MASASPHSPTSIPPLVGTDQLALAAYNQNFENFRSLNALMWQIPLIAMTLTGGLWFGVSSIKDMPLMRVCLLLLAAIGDFGLIVVLARLRHILGCYLKWIEDAFPRGYVDAPGKNWRTGPETVKTAFQIMLLLSGIISTVLFCAAMPQLLSSLRSADSKSAAAWYDTHAARLADGYEGLTAEETHPKLFALLKGSVPLRVLDVGAGTGRDAAALAALGHRVTAVDPSTKMLRLARSLHADRDITWVADGLPTLGKASGPYDLIVVSAVWMHVPPADRAKAFDRLMSLLAPKGRLYVTLRLGPAEPERAVWTVNAKEIANLAADRGLQIVDWGKRPDLLGRAEVQWQTLLLTKPN
jgi:SAM-dependent methyltransferase